MLRTAVVVPCYNEAARLDAEAFARCCAARPDVRFVFVDDGSSDGTAAMLTAMCARLPAQLECLQLPQNVGKAEAVRRGLLRALDGSPPPAAVGFWDADLATPLADIEVFADRLAADPELLAVFGARVNLLGRAVHRNLLRHYVGRVFATVVASMLRLPIYDTQCGAKLLRATPALRALLAEPFLSRWIFDVELIMRLQEQLQRSGGPPAARAIFEHPLMEWRDVAGSKLRLRHFATVAADLLRIWQRLRRGPP